MWILRINRIFRNGFRLMSIVLIILRHSLRNAMYGNRFIRRIIDPRGKNLTTRSERIRLMIEDLGPTFIKFGQILADRPDLVSEQLRTELKKLQSSARPFDNDIAFRIIEEELGDPIPAVFEEISIEPIASASIAQVYKGLLKNGESVAVKVQRPGIKQKISIDLVLIHILAERVVNSYPELASFNVVEFVDDFGAIMKKELDFSNEASNMMRFTEMFREDENCHIPKVYLNLTTQKVLIMEFISGITPGSREELEALGCDVESIGKNGVNIVLKMILQHGFFHADPHPGNLMIKGRSQIVLLDHGMVATLKPAQIQALIQFMMGFAKKDSHKITKAILELLQVKYYKDIADLEFEISELIQKYSYIPYAKIDVSVLLGDTFKVIMRHGLKIPPNLYMLLKALGTIQKFAEALKVNLSIIDMIEPYARQKIMEKFSMRAIWRRVVNSAEEYLYLVDRLPSDIKEIINNMRTGVLKHEINFREDSFTNKALRQNFNRLAYVFVLGLLLVCTTILMVYKPDNDIVKWMFYVTCTVLIWTAIRLFFNTKFK